MGSSGSKNIDKAAKYGQIYIQTDKPSYSGGETVIGNIYINLIAPYPGNQLFLKLKGIEAVYFVGTKGDSKDSIQPEELQSEKRTIIRQDFPIHSWTSLESGQFIIPFEFMFPHSLPPSFHQRGFKYSAYIAYHLEAYLKPPNKNIPKLKCKQNVIVRESLRGSMQGYSNQIKTQLKTCGCIQQGTNILKAHFAKSSYIPGEVAQVVMQLDNSKSGLDNKKIICSLKQRLKLAIKGNPREQIFTKVYRELPGVPTKRFSESNYLALNLPPLQEEFSFQDKNQFSLAALSDLKESNYTISSTTHSKLITSEYYLEVSCPMSGCFSTTPMVICPVSICHPDVNFAPVAAPEHWEPETIKRVSIGFAPPPEEYSPTNNFGMMENFMPRKSQGHGDSSVELIKLISSGNKRNSEKGNNSFARNYNYQNQ